MQVAEEHTPGPPAGPDLGTGEERRAAIVAGRLARSRQMRARRQRIVRARLVLARGLMRL